MAGLLALLTSPSSRAAVDAQLNTSNFVSGQASELSIDGVITSGGPSTTITGATMTLRFDPADLSLSGFRAGSGWSLLNTNTDNLSQGWVKGVLTNTENNGAGQTVTGPILYFTVSPANGQVDPDDCDTLRFAGVESDLADQDYNPVYPSDPCEGLLQSRVYTYDVLDGFSGWTDRAELADNCQLAKALTNLRITAGLQGFAPDDLVYLDLDRNRKVDIVDAVLALETPCFSVEATYDQAPYASPAVLNTDADNYQEIPVAVQSQAWGEPLCVNPSDPSESDPRFCTSNPELVYLYEWSGTGLGTLAGWPQRLRDSSQGVAIADLGSGYRVLASCFQDNHLDNPNDPNQIRAKPSTWPPCVDPFLGSRIYAWDLAGSPISPWCPPPLTVPSLPDTQRLSLPWGHTTAAPVVYQPDPDQPAKVVQAAQGRYADWTLLSDSSVAGVCPKYVRSDPKYGKLLIWNADGSLLGTTQSTDATAPWYVMPEDPTYPGNPDVSRSSVSAPPVAANLLGTGNDCLVAATDDGWLYAWDKDGSPVPGWHPYADLQNPPGPAPQTAVATGGTERQRITALNSLAAVVFGGTDGLSIVACSGGFDFGWRPISPSTEGRVYRFLASGGAAYRTFTAPGGAYGFASGIAVGRLGSLHSSQLCIVVGNNKGHVFALDKDLAVIWEAVTTENSPIVAQPIIGDVDDDGRQDVVVAAIDGFIYAFDGDPDPNVPGVARRLWRVPTPVSVISGVAYSDIVFGPAPAMARLASGGHLHIVICSYTQRSSAVQQDHLVVIDCGVTNTNDHSRYDWPQYQRDARRRGAAYPSQ